MKKPIQFGKYLLLDRINVGGMAEVFKAKAFGVEGFERFVAVKRILPNIAEDEEFITMFIDEAKISVQLNHANIAQIFDLGRVDDSYFIALELVQGKDLRAMFDTCRNKPQLNAGSTSMPIAQACFVVMKACEGLDYAHNKRDAQGRELHLVHRDVSPQNILISYEGEVKLIDFGIAKAAGKASKTQQGILKGKFGYMSPEQVRGLPLDRRSDVFSLGILLYELLTGERLFVGESDFSTLEKVRNVEILPPSTYNRKINDELERIVMKALAKDVDDRYQNAIDVHDDLQAYMYSAGEFYSRKDLAAWMKKVYAADIEAEVAKLESYRALPGLAAPSAPSPPSPPSPGGVLSPPPPPPRRSSSQSLPAVPAHAPLVPPPAPRPTGNVTAAARPPLSAASQRGDADADMQWDDEELATNIYDQPEDAADAIVDEKIVNAQSASGVPSAILDGDTETAPSDEAERGDPADADQADDEIGSHLARVPLSPDGAPVFHSAVQAQRKSGALATVPAPVEDAASGPTPFAAAMAGSNSPSQGLAVNLGMGPVVASPKATPVAKTVQMDAPVLDLPSSKTAAGKNLPVQTDGHAGNGKGRGNGKGKKRDAFGDILGEETGEAPLPEVVTRPAAAMPTMVIEARGPRNLFVGLVAGGAIVLLGVLGGVAYMVSSKPGEVLITSEPSAGVQVLVNNKRVQDSHGVPIEDTPLPLTLSPGSYQLTVQLPGYLPWNEQVVVKSGDHLAKKIVLEPLAATAGFTLASTPSGADVTLDGKPTGYKTPIKVEALLPGAHHLAVSGEGGTWETDVNLEVGKMVDLHATLTAAATAPSKTDHPTEIVHNDGKPAVTAPQTPTEPKPEPVAVKTPETTTAPVAAPVEVPAGAKEAKPEPKPEVKKAKPEPLAVKTPDPLDETDPPPTKPDPKATAPKEHKPAPVDTDSKPVEAKAEKPESKPEKHAPAVTPAAPAGDGYLRLGSKPWTNIAVDGKDTGMHTPQTKLKLSAGPHRITLTNPEFNVRESFSVDIKPGDTQTVIKDLQTPATSSDD